MRSKQVAFKNQNNLFYMAWEIETNEQNDAKIKEYISERLYKWDFEREELRKTKNGWYYAIYRR